MTLSESKNIPCECIPDIAAGFGGGMKIQSVCGAVTGAIMAMGLKYGNNSTKVRKTVIKFLRTFQKAHGTLTCKKLLGVDVTTENGIKEYKKRNLHTRCEHVVSTAVEVAETLLSSE